MRELKKDLGKNVKDERELITSEEETCRPSIGGRTMPTVEGEFFACAKRPNKKSVTIGRQYTSFVHFVPFVRFP